MVIWLQKAIISQIICFVFAVQVLGRIYVKNVLTVIS